MPLPSIAWQARRNTARFATQTPRRDPTPIPGTQPQPEPPKSLVSDNKKPPEIRRARGPQISSSLSCALRIVPRLPATTTDHNLNSYPRPACLSLGADPYDNSRRERRSLPTAHTA